MNVLFTKKKWILFFLTPACFVTLNKAQPQTQTTAKTTQKKEVRVKEEPDPTAAVAGGVGKEGFKPPKYAVLPTGKTLPAGIFKIDFPLAYSFGSQGITSDGTKDENGLEFKRWMGGVIINYGVSHTVSVGVGIPIAYSNTASLNGDTFLNSALYQKYYNKFVEELSAKLSQTPGSPCSTEAECRNFIDTGGALGPLPIVLPTGEAETIRGTAPIRDQIRQFITRAATPSSGSTGIGDVQLGILWNAISEESPIRGVPLYFSIGGGLRMPTGKFNLPSALRATGGDGTLISGGGTYDAILRWNLDYIATPGVILSWQHQSEYSLTEADLGRTSMVNPTQFNTANPAACTNGVCGDGVSNNLVFSRKGIHQIGFLQAAWGLGNVSESWRFLGLYSQAKYNIAAQAYLNDMPIYIFNDQFFLNDPSLHPNQSYEQFYAVTAGVKFSGLPYMVPVELSTEFEYPFYGKNRFASPMNWMTTLSVFF